MALLTFESVGLAYGGDNVAHDVSFSVQAGEFWGIVGENGSGKTTLMKALLGLIPCASGRIVMGEGLKPAEIGYLPQQSAIQKDFPASVEEVVLSGTITRRPPWSSAPQISQTEKSNETEWNKVQTSLGRKPNQPAVALKSRVTAACSMATPFGLPVEPEV